MLFIHTVSSALRVFCLAMGMLLLPQATLGVPAKNHPTRVNLRIEGANRTIFEGPIVTRGHNVTTVSGGAHHCDGTNNGENEFPGPTCTSALDDAARKEEFQWDGTFFEEFDDYFITSIADSTETTTQFWGILLNFVFTPVGGCQQEVKPEDHILWAFDAFNAEHFLELVGPKIAKKGVPTKLGALVHGETSDSDGAAKVTFGRKGKHGLKATKDGSIRSNQVFVQVV
ncbi:surface cell-adhesion protein [Favolaschia claudopus]|uniref:Surface cell-adhesion protein n=1 Tax=Favolaschia claudopus TaxID=2862362 RepID=A0AAW0AX33_9AGAR